MADVTVLEASGRPGGHVRTSHDPFADGLYADLGAEHFYYPGYTEYWRYLKEFTLTPIPRIVKKVMRPACGSTSGDRPVAPCSVLTGTHPLFSRWEKQNIFLSLMVALSMVVLHERRDRPPQRRLAEQNQPRQAFLFY